MKPRLIAPALRAEVLERDGGDESGAPCRICGRWVNTPAVHHIVYKSQGGLDVMSNLITVGWLPWEHDCHLPIAHGPDARAWREVLLEIASGDDHGISALQWRRWQTESTLNVR